MVGSISRKLLTELEIRTENAECKLMGDKCNFVIFVLIIKSCVSQVIAQSFCLILAQAMHTRKLNKVI